MRESGIANWAVLPLPGFYVGDYGEAYKHRRNEVILFEYVRGPRSDEQGTPLLADDIAGDGGGVGGVGEVEECWWLVGTKCCGDEHVPMGRCSFRICVDAAPLMISPHAAPPILNQEGAGISDISQFVGSGMLARPGNYGASFVAGVFTCRSNGDVTFSWSADQDAVVFHPRVADHNEFVGLDLRLGMKELRQNDAEALRQRAQLVPSNPQSASDAAPTYTFYGAIGYDEDDEEVLD
eukprot:CAMPEP_0179433836 /NCGR_PEP_ID=MMETSP0799-20121207/18177_1 /TAXON_ID=46947 /ORGANISM="Geminigera cryophila, Strain CCMP2564" /LENGTH=236 /DNA_ID=CAMNT_0021212067 /DNA_START=155 /DNA_END=865 /DNA_ORIENTATION=-